MIVGTICVSIEKQDLTNFFVDIPIGSVCVVLAILGYYVMRSPPPTRVPGSTVDPILDGRLILDGGRTECPECFASVHIDTTLCPLCGAPVQRMDRTLRTLKRSGFIFLVLFGLMMIVGTIGASIEKQTSTNLLVGYTNGPALVVVGILGYRGTRSRGPKDSNSIEGRS